MKIKKSMLKQYEQIGRDFFDINEVDQTATIRLHFESPQEVFDMNCLSKTPIFNDDFDEWLRSAFEMVPGKYQIALDFSFDDMGGYTPEELKEIFDKNLMLSARMLFQTVRTRDHIAFGLIAAGLLSFLVMMLIQSLWITESFLREGFFYFLDIATTVLFWEAAGILLVENREHRVTMKAYRQRFTSICFH